MIAIDSQTKVEKVKKQTKTRRSEERKLLQKQGRKSERHDGIETVTISRGIRDK